MSHVWGGNGREYDVAFTPGPQLKTTTSQYKAVGIPWTSTVAAQTAYLCNNATANENTGTAYAVIGINQTYLSANSSECTIRLFGISRAKCAASIPAGFPVVAYAGASTTTFPGFISALAEGTSIGAATASVTTFFRVLGYALEAGSTNQVISIMIQPSYAEKKTITE